MIPEKPREILERALKRGGAALLEQFGSSTRATIKESISSVVTEADLASEHSILEVLGNTTQPYNIITEESGYVDNRSAYTWVVDPLDGTSNYAAGLPWFGIIITLCREQEPIQAAMYLPVEDQIYYTWKGGGAWKNNKSIRCTEATDLSELLVSYSFDFNQDPEKTDAEMNLLASLSRKIRNTRSTNSLIDFCYTADGRLGAAINQTTKIWDIAAPWLMIREAGGVVSDISGAEIRLEPSPASINRNYTIVASGAGIHGKLMRIIQQD